MPVAKGLEGVVVDTSSICLIDGNAGRLIYGGYDIHELVASTSFEEVVHLLWKGDLPTRSQLAELKTQLSNERSLADSVVALMARLPRESGTLDVLRTVISALGVDLPLQKPDVRQAIAITAKVPTIVAGFQRMKQGQRPIPPNPELDHAANYLYMLTAQVPEEGKADAMDDYMICTADHGMNASTFAARVVASTFSDMYSAVVAAVGALKGPLHGGAPGPVLEMLHEIQKPERARQWMSEQLGQGKRLMGFGHRVYRTMDPRAAILRDLASRMADKNFFALAQEVEKVGLELLREKAPDYANTNVEFYSAVLMDAIGLQSDAFTPTFATSRVAGWTAHIIEQAANNRLIRPSTEYIGPRDRKVLPIDAR